MSGALPQLSPEDNSIVDVSRVAEQHIFPRCDRVLAVRPYMRRNKGVDGVLESFQLQVEFGGVRESTYVNLRRGARERMEGEQSKVDGFIGDPRLSTASSWLSPDGSRLYYPFPRDREIRRAADLLNVRRVLRLVRGAIEPSGGRISKRRSQVSVASYRPERRLVVLWRFVVPPRGSRQEHGIFVRRYGGNMIPAELRMRLVSALTESGLSVPSPIPQDDEDTWIEAALPGGPLESSRPQEHEVVGRVLAAIHGVPPPVGLLQPTADSILLGIRRSARDLLDQDTALGSAALRVVDRLSRTPPGPATCSLLHGDAHPGQFMVNADQVGVLDWDRSQIGDPELDLATYNAHLQMRMPAAAPASSRSLLRAYRWAGGRIDAHRLSWYRAVATLRLVTLPYRWYVPNWRAHVVQLLRCAGKEVERL